jgi:hypothetical protein
MDQVVPLRAPEMDAIKRKVFTCRTCKLKRCVGRCQWETSDSQRETSNKPKAA